MAAECKPDRPAESSAGSSRRWPWIVATLLVALTIALLSVALGNRRDRTADAAGTIRHEASDPDGLPAELAAVGTAATTPVSREEVDVPPATPEGLRFLVVAHGSKEPVASAELTALGASRPPFGLGVTDSEGVLSSDLPFEGDEYVHVAVEAQGFAPQTRNVGFQREGEVVVFLVEAGTLRGFVVDAAGAPVPYASVLAYPTSKRLSVPEQVTWLRNGWWPGGATTCDATGHFSLDGLAIGVRHAVVAGNASGISEDRDVGVPGQEAPMTITLRELVGAYVEAVQEGGEPLPTDGLSSNDGLYWGAREVDYLSMNFQKRPVEGSFVLALTGLDIDALLPTAPATELLLALKTSTTPGPYPFDYGVRWPGFRDASGRGTLEPWGPGFPSYTITMWPSAAVGYLVVTFDMEESLKEAPTSYRMPLASLLVQGLESSVIKELRVNALDEPSRFALPAGLYQVQCTGGLERRIDWPMVGGDRDLVIREGQEVKISFKVEGVGSVFFRFENHDDPGYDGRVDLVIRGQTAAGSTILTPTLMRPPYRLPYVVAGDYEIQEVRSPANDGHESQPGLIRVVAGAETSVTLVLE